MPKHSTTQRRSVMHRLACLISVMALATGCSSLPAVPKTVGVNLFNWQGRFSAITEPVSSDGLSKTRDKESIAGQFNLSQSESNELNLELANPLGVAVARLRVGTGKAVLQIANQADRQATDLDTLTEQAMGWRVPIDKMAQWLNGKSHGPADAALFDADGRLVEATDGGWRLSVSAWRENGKPQRLLLQWPASASFAPKVPYTKVELRLIVDYSASTVP